MRRKTTDTGPKPWGALRRLPHLLAPFLISAAYPVFYCGQNLPRAWGCLTPKRLVLASGPRPSSSTEGRPSDAHATGEGIARVLRDHAAAPPPLWSLEFWNNPAPYARVEVTNRPTPGGGDAVAGLFKRKGEPGAVDLAIVQDGLTPGPDAARRVRSLVPLYRTTLCVFARKSGPFRTLRDVHERKARVYLGHEGGDARRLARRVMDGLGVDCREVHPDWDPGRVAAAMAAGGPEGDAIDVACVLDRLDSGAVRRFAAAGAFDLVSVDDADDLFRDDAFFRSSASVRAVRLPGSSVCARNGCPSREVTTVETRAVLACSADLPEEDAFQITGTLKEHFGELGLRPDPGTSPDGAGGLDFPPHPGAARFGREGRKPEGFPYAVLVVAVGASVALVVYWKSLAMLWRADRLVAKLDAAVDAHRHDPAALAGRLDALHAEAVTRFKRGAIAREGLDRVRESLALIRSSAPTPLPPAPRRTDAPSVRLRAGDARGAGARGSEASRRR